ncbi:hypothetical protein ABZT04_42330 [Streptomyces sp. NPDC005492]|uniref:hypothetical protein n=1 Tax=Streptomyces sp. NPDC005492 TaxID=3156883 RepID=UPI0033A0EF02
MRRRRGSSLSAEPDPMQHLRATVWGPAEFVGLPPRRLVAEGIFVGILGVGAITGTTLFGA